MSWITYPVWVYLEGHMQLVFWKVEFNACQVSLHAVEQLLLSQPMNFSAPLVSTFLMSFDFGRCGGVKWTSLMESCRFPHKNYNRTFSINNFRNCELICRAGGSGGAGGARGARAPPPPTFWHRKKKGRRRRRKKGKESVHPVPDRNVYMYKKISPSNCTKMYKTSELPGAPPPGPHPLWARLRKRSLTIDIPII